ncbi:hypothetical protein SRHO_G00106330 [Serrasalmus rhombeus]
MGGVTSVFSWAADGQECKSNQPLILLVDQQQQHLRGVLEMDAHAISHEFIFIDEAGFNLARTRRRGRNITGHRENITMCAAISNTYGVLHHHANLITQPIFSHFSTTFSYQSV